MSADTPPAVPPTGGLTVDRFIEAFRLDMGWKCEPGTRITNELTAFAAERAGSRRDIIELFGGHIEACEYALEHNELRDGSVIVDGVALRGVLNAGPDGHARAKDEVLTLVRGAGSDGQALSRIGHWMDGFVADHWKTPAPAAVSSGDTGPREVDHAHNPANPGSGDTGQATLTVASPKMLRETMCLAQAALGEWARQGRDVDRVPRHTARLGELIAQLDVHRPLGPDGKHGDRHTPTCGCEDRPSGDTGQPAAAAGSLPVDRNGHGLPVFATEDWTIEAMPRGEVHVHTTDHRDPPGGDTLVLDGPMIAAITSASGSGVSGHTPAATPSDSESGARRPHDAAGHTPDVAALVAERDRMAARLADVHAPADLPEVLRTDEDAAVVCEAAGLNLGEAHCSLWLNDADPTDHVAVGMRHAEDYWDVTLWSGGRHIACGSVGVGMPGVVLWDLIASARANARALLGVPSPGEGGNRG